MKNRLISLLLEIYQKGIYKKYAKDLSNKEALKVILKNSYESQKDVPGNGISKNFKIQATTEQSQNNRRQSDAQSHSRYIRIKTQRQIHQKTNGKCAYPACTRPIENFHHPIPFSFNRSHESVVGLCKIHHAFCHNGIIKNEFKEPNEWKLNLAPQRSLTAYGEKRKSLFPIERIFKFWYNILINSHFCAK